jgi:putative transferase (TIGR04331 family)
MFIATTAVEEFWDTSDELLFLGEWSKLYARRSVWGALPHQTLPYPWPDAASVEPVGEYCQATYERFLALLGKALNDALGRSWNTEQYRLVVGPWLMYFIHQAFDKYTALKQAFDAFPDAHTRVLASEQFYTPLDFPDYIQLHSDDRYQLQMYSVLLVAMGYVFPSGKLSRPLHTPDHWESGASLKDAIHRVSVAGIAALARLRLGRGGAVIVQPVFNRRGRFANWASLLLRSGFRLTPDDYRYRVRVSSKKNPGLRALIKLDAGEGLDEFGAVLARLIPDALPVGYLEGFGTFLGACDKTPKRNATTYYSANGLFASTLFCFDMARLGTRRQLVYQQHGGGYGIDALSPPEEHERACADQYFTWGWQGPGARFLPHPKIPGPATRQQQTSGVLLVMTANPRYVFLFHCQVISSQILSYIERSIVFCANLPSKLALTIRPQFQENGWDLIARVQDRDISFNLDRHECSFETAVSRSRVCVIDHLATTFLEAMALNSPTVIFFPPGAYLIREEASPLFERLRTVGILHDSAEAAARHVTNVYDEPLRWWDSEAVQDVRRAFCERYCRYEKDWVGAWIRELAP